ncbi:hypothetical protein MHTCC0001_08580 [Flavobacteriaceae bacterium MHTCC 0001]
MKLHFKLPVIVVWLYSVGIFGQTESIISKSFETDAKTTALIKLNGEYVQILSSPDNKLYVEYTIDFENYPERKKTRIRDKIDMDIKKVDNHISIISKSFSPWWELAYEHLFKKDSSFKISSKRKTKSDIVKEIEAFYTRKNPYVETIELFFHNDIEKKNSLIEKENRKKTRTFYETLTIKIPPSMDITIGAKDSKIIIKDAIENKLSIRLDGGRIIARSLKNKHNFIKVRNALVGIQSLNGGKLFLNSVKKGLIASVEDTELTAEFSNIEIGHIGKNNTFTDFSNTTVIYNFSDDFETFKLKSEYSKLHCFKPNDNFGLKVSGYNTIVNENGKKVNKNLNGKNDLFNINKKEDQPFSGQMDWNIVHGFVFLYQ